VTIAQELAHCTYAKSAEPYVKNIPAPIQRATGHALCTPALSVKEPVNFMFAVNVAELADCISAPLAKEIAQNIPAIMRLAIEPVNYMFV